MNDNEHNTNRPRHQDGPVTRALRAVRETAGPFLVPVVEGAPMLSGWHIGRRHDWTDAGREEVVWLDVQEHDSEWIYGVWRAGGSKPEHPDAWTFSLRLGGIRSMPAEPLELRATALH